MKTIFLINDNSAAAKHAGDFVLAFAKTTNANVIVANTFITDKKSLKQVPTGDFNEFNNQATHPDDNTGFFWEFKADGAMLPEIAELDISNMSEDQISKMINKDKCEMIVAGVSKILLSGRLNQRINAQLILNKVQCPLLLIPENWTIKTIERMVYITDLRYCRIQIVRQLSHLASLMSAEMSIAHLTSKGLPPLDENYARQIFCEEICRNISYERLLFNNINENDLSKAVDVMVSCLHNDILVLVNHHFHLDVILGHYVTNITPPVITVPLFIFPY